MHLYLFINGNEKFFFRLQNTQLSYANFASAFIGKLLKRNEWQSQTSNVLLFVFMDFEKNPAFDVSRIWNCNESSFPTDASKGTVVRPMEN